MHFFVQVVDFREPKLEDKLADAKLSLPNIVKPQVACGVADAHSMVMLNSQSNINSILGPSLFLSTFIY